MRQKAERAIREAAAGLKDSSGWYRIDQVRERTALIRKVFDKTILDMARVGTVQLASVDAKNTGDAHVGDLITYGEKIYISFAFLEPDADQVKEPEKPKSEITEPKPLNNNDLLKKEPRVGSSMRPEATEKVNITLQGFYRTEWEQFEYLCKVREGKKGIHKIWEMICEYNRRGN